MSDEIRQSGDYTRVTPLNRPRDTGPRKNPRKPAPKPDANKRRQPPKDDQAHHIDEYA